jgi:two-component system CheB/CheR fusion protein
MQITAENRSPTPIVAIGASAGGLEALQALFSGMPAGSGFAFVVIQRLAPDHDSRLAQLLGRSSKLPVGVVVGGARAEPNRVYVVAPGTTLGIASGRFHVGPADEHHAPIDAFFKALAGDLGRFSVGIVLSGSGSDGTAGLRAIQGAGGLTLAQAPATAAQAAMSQSAIDAGVAQHVLSIDEMPARLVERAQAIADGRIALPAVAAPPAAAPPSDHELVLQLGAIYEVLQRATGHDFSHYKRGTVLRRLHRRLQLRHAASPDAYVALLSSDPLEAEQLGKDLLIGVTQFFREPEAFEYLELDVLPQVFAAKRQDEGVRIWVPGCTSGEEVYSIGMLVREQLDEVKGTHPVQILATDIDAEAIAEARVARYPADIAGAVSPARLARFFRRDGAAYHIAREVREMCVFSEHSLIRDPPFLSIDLISCRNVLIYLDDELQKRLVPVFHHALRPGGFLFLGSAEGLAGHPELFELTDKQFRVFRRLEPVIRPMVEFPLASLPALRTARPPVVARPSPAINEQAVSAVFERLMLQEYVPPGAVVTAQGDIVCVAGLTGRYLQPPAGVLTTNILDIAHAGLRIELRTALHSAARSGRKIVKDDVAIDIDGEQRQVRITVRPLHGVKRDDLFAVVLQDQSLAAETGEAGEPLPVREREQVEQLESELLTTRNQLRATIEELEAANEELKSSNEEMLSTNEEMQSSNEELQSSQEELRAVNEELATVNAELARKFDELARANSDLQNLFSSTDIATVFLDCELQVTRFTPAAKSLFRLIDADIGRPLFDLAQRFANLDPADVTGVLRTLDPLERQVETVDRRACYLLRVRPYHTVENAIAGAVITLTDITQVKRAEAERERLVGELREAHDRLTADLEATNRLLKVGALFLHEGNLEPVLGEVVDAAISIAGADCGNIQIVDPATGALTIAAHRGLPAWWLEYWNAAPRDRGACGAALARRERVIVEDVERDPIFTATPGLAVQRRAGVRAVQSTPLLSRTGVPVGILSTYSGAPGSPPPRVLQFLDLLARQAADIIERVRGEHALKDSEARFRALIDVSSEALYRVSPDWSEVRELKSRRFLAPADATSRSWLERYILPEDQPDVKAVIDRAIRIRGVFELEHRVVRADGTPGWAWSRAAPLMDAGGHIIEWFGAASDVTARKRAELELGEANRRLLEADRRKSEFLAVLSHELRNPLAPIRSCLDVLEHTSPASGAGPDRRAYEVIRRQFDHLTRLVDDLLDVTRITSGKIALQRQVLDLNELARHAVDDHRDAFIRGGIALEFAAAPAPVCVSGDRARLTQVVGNLLHNAAKFTPRGGTTRVSIDSEPARGHAVIRVTDTGRGIAPEVVPRLFEPFTQVDAALDRQRGGLGLGLAIAKGMIELHGGSIRVDSEGPGTGARFTIALPQETCAELPVDPEPDTPSSRAARRVLVIEDNADAANALRNVLELAGHWTQVAYNGPDGLRHARGFAPDVVFCDIGLPEMDGYKVARALRADPALHQVKLVAVSGYGAPEDLAKAQAAGFDVHVTKPVSMTRLEQILDELEAARPAAP